MKYVRMHHDSTNECVPSIKSYVILYDKIWSKFTTKVDVGIKKAELNTGVRTVICLPES